MKLNTKLFAILALGSAIACSSPNKKESTEKKEAGNCKFELLNEAKVSFTSYKTTDKAAVGGSFKDAELMLANNGAESLTASLEGAQMRIATNSVLTGDSIRDGHIRNYFFGTMSGGDAMKGQIQSVTGTDEAGEASVFLNMNGLGEKLNLSYKVEEGVLVLLGTIDLEMWNALSSLASLNKQCFDLHKGPDGDSKLWQTVDVRIEIPVNKKDC